MASAADDILKPGLTVLGLGNLAPSNLAAQAAKSDDSKTDKSAKSENPNVIPSAPLSGFLGETEIAGAKVGLHMTTRGVIGAGYVALGIGLIIVGLVFVVGGLSETKALVKGVTRGLV